MKDISKLELLPSKRLARFIRENPDIVADIYYDGGFTTPTGYAYDVLMAEGWGHTGLCDHMHTIIEPRASEVINFLKTAEKCTSETCPDMAK